MKVKFNTNRGEHTGTLIKENPKTVIVKFDYKEKIEKKGAKAIFKTYTTFIKRRKIRDHVLFI